MKWTRTGKGATWRRAAGVAALAMLVLSAGVGVAVGDISSTIFALTASNDSGSGSLAVDFSAGNWDPVSGEYTWSLGAPVDIVDDNDPGIVVASLNSAMLTIETAPTPSITLTVGTGAGDSNTDFHIDSAVVSFSQIPPSAAEGRFAASAQLWDTNFDGAYLVGLDGSGVGALQSYYNGQAPAGTRFSHLIGAIVVGSGANGSASQSFPSVGYASIGEGLGDISVHGAFVVSGGDRAVSTLAFGIVPEPSACLLLLCAGMLSLGKLRRR